MIVRLERVVPFPRDAVYAWWTDFREDDHPGPPSPATSTREILRSEGNRVWLRERARRPAPVTIEERVVLDPPSSYTVTARYPGASAEYTYRFERDPGGTRIRLTALVRPRHVGRVLLPLLHGWGERYAARDLDYHLGRMAEDLRSQASSRGPLHQSIGRASDTPHSPSE